MEVHQEQVRLARQLAENLVRPAEGVVHIGVHGHPADQVDDPDLQPHRPVKNTVALAGQPLGKVGRPQQIGAVVQVTCDLHLAPGVVAQGHHVGPGVKHLLHLAGQHADAGGVFPVDHGEVNTVLLFHPAQVSAEEDQAALRHHVPHCQHLENHIFGHSLS